jgi:hypothetical protein
MEVILFSDSVQTRLWFAPLERSRSVKISFLPCSSLKKGLKEARRDAFVYVDISGQGDEEKERMLHYLRNYGKSKYGIIDPEGWVPDVGMLFHNGAGDYVGAPINGSITIRRVKKALAIHPYMLEIQKKTLCETGIFYRETTGRRYDRDRSIRLHSCISSLRTRWGSKKTSPMS